MASRRRVKIIKIKNPDRIYVSLVGTARIARHLGFSHCRFHDVKARRERVKIGQCRFHCAPSLHDGGSNVTLISSSALFSRDEVCF
jgi:hypothetical protein